MELNEEIIFPQIKDNIPKKVSLCYHITINKPVELSNEDPIYKLITTYSDIENIQNMNENQKTKFLYFNRKYVHKLLLKFNRTINFKYEEINKNLSFYFYLILLIKDNPYILNYTFDSEYIKEINIQQEQNNKLYNKLIISKIIIELANNYKSIYDCFNDENEEKINKIIDLNLSIIKDNINILKEINIKWTQEDFCSKSLDLIYVEIIIELIKQKKFEDFEFTYEIIKQLDLENIDITKIMFDKVYEILNSNENYINDYMIIKGEDIYDEKIINFYFILMYYILKNQIYIYQIPFLMKVSKTVNNILKSSYMLNMVKNIEVFNRATYLINLFTNTIDKYFRKMPDLDVNNKIPKEDNSLITKNKDEEELLNYFNPLTYKNLTSLDYIYLLYKFFSIPELKKGIEEIVDNPTLVKNTFNLLNIRNNEFFDSLKRINKEEFKQFLHMDNCVEIMIREVYYYIDPYKEIKNLESNLPIKTNSKIVQIFSEFMEKE